MSFPTLSVVMSNYNHAHYIREALDAILAQTLKPIEIIVIDDASTDDSVRIIEDYIRRYPIIRLIRNEKNQGHIISDNNAISIAKGDYVHPTAADDTVLPGMYEKSLNLLARFPQAGVCSALMRTMDDQSRDTGLIDVPTVADHPVYIDPDQVEEFLRNKKPWFTGVTTIYRRQSFMDAGGYTAELRNYSDAVMSQIIALKHGACFIPEVLGVWRVLSKGYASTMHANLSIQIDIVQLAVRLFKNPPHSNMMSAEFADRWGREWIYQTLSRVIKEHRDNSNRLMNLSSHPLDRFLFCLLRLMAILEWLVVRLFVFGIFRNENLFAVLGKRLGKSVPGMKNKTPI